MPGSLLNADEIARPYRDAVREAVRLLRPSSTARSEFPRPPVMLRAILASDRRASEVYARYTETGCRDVGIGFELVTVPPLEVEPAIYAANADPRVHGIMVYYPVFGGARDRTLQGEVAPEKDVEGLSPRWVRALYDDVRTTGEDGKKSVLPCTPLAILKAFEHTGFYARGAAPGTQARGKTVTIFNRSEVVGRPLAAMLAHDGARVWSFDVDGCLEYEGAHVRESQATRGVALSQSDAVVTGVPSKDFDLVKAAELKPGAVCINFSTAKNMADDVLDRASAFLPRTGPITVAMLLRNTLRLYENFHR